MSSSARVLSWNLSCIVAALITRVAASTASTARGAPTRQQTTRLWALQNVTGEPRVEEEEGAVYRTIDLDM